MSVLCVLIFLPLNAVTEFVCMFARPEPGIIFFHMYLFIVVLCVSSCSCSNPECTL